MPAWERFILCYVVCTNGLGVSRAVAIEADGPKGGEGGGGIPVLAYIRLLA